MATIEAIAYRRAVAMELLNSATRIIGEELGVEPPVVPVGAPIGDPLTAQANQLKVLADWAMRIAERLAPDRVPVATEMPDQGTELHAPLQSSGESVPLSAPVPDEATVLEFLKNGFGIVPEPAESSSPDQPVEPVATKRSRRSRR